jgi:hypothetical protein
VEKELLEALLNTKNALTYINALLAKKGSEG